MRQEGPPPAKALGPAGNLASEAERYRQIFECSPVGIATHDAAGGLVDINPAAMVMFGIEDPAAVRGVQLLMDPNLPPEHRKALARGKTVRTCLVYDFDQVRRIGHYRTSRRGTIDLDATITPFGRTGSPSFGGYLVQVQDITDRVRADWDLKEKEAKLRFLFDILPVGISVLDHERRVVIANRALEHILGLDLQQLLSATHAARTYLRSDGSVMPQEEIPSARALRDGQRVSDPEVGVVKENGEVIWVGVTAVPLPFADWSLVTVTSDVTARRRAEDNLRRLLREKETLLREVHHRVRNNLQVVSALLSIESDRVRDPADLVIFRGSQNRIRSMALMHERLLASGVPGEVHFADYARSLLGRLFDSYGGDGERIRWEVSSDDQALDPDTAVLCGLILNELASNTLEHAFPGDRRGRLTVTLRGAREGPLTLAVEDDGVGMPPGFDWTRATTTGMQLVKVLCEQLGGRAELDGGEGVRFRIAFRLRKGEA